MGKYYTFVLLLVGFVGRAQVTNIRYGLEAQALYTSFKQPSSADKFDNSFSPKMGLPFWMRANKFGSVPLRGVSGSLIGTVRRDYDSTAEFTDWGFAIEGRADLGRQVRFRLIEGYAKFRVGVFEAKAGRVKELHGLTDSTLSSGSFSVSGNALGIPKIQLAVPDYVYLPHQNVVALKGNLAHGWVGKTDVHYRGTTPPIHLYMERAQTYFHQFSLYGRLGKPEWRWRLYGGFNHEVYWGNERKIFGGDWKLSLVNTYKYALLGRKYSTANGYSAAIGNHVGSVDVGAEYDFRNMQLLAYRQSFNDKGSLLRLKNIKDGLNGIRLLNTASDAPLIGWRKFVLEVLYTKNQSVENGTKVTSSVSENYYNHYLYAQGWSYRGLNVGSPFFSSKAETRVGLAAAPGEHFVNNRLLLFHTGFEGYAKEWRFITKLSYSKNYGTYATSAQASPDLPPYVVFKTVTQFSTYFEGGRPLKNGYNIGVATAFDRGELLYNSVAVMIKFWRWF